MEQKVCESCGISFKSINEYSNKTLETKYCNYCTDNQGNLKSYNEKLTDFKNLLLKNNNYGEEQAKKIAKIKMKQFPAWKDIQI